MDRPAIPLIGPKFFKDAVKVILDYIDANRPVSGIGVDVADVAGGRAINAKSSSGRSRAAIEIAYPFKTSLRANPDNPEAYQASVALGSNLYAGFGNWGNITIIGLDSWFSVAENDYIYLTGTYVDGELDSVNVDSGGALPGRILVSTGDDPVQTSWTTRIARIVVIDEVWTVEQNLFQHLTISSQCVAGVSCGYPIPAS